MACVVGAFVPETAAKADDFLVVNGGAAGDDLFVDEFLDFSNDYSETEEQQQPQDELETKEQGINENNESNIIITTTCSASQDNNNGFSEQNYDFAPLPEPELGLHGEGLESLEWLSHFSEDSFPDYSLTGKLQANPPEKTTEPAEPVHEQPCFTTPVQTKARTKRGRTGVRVWPVLSHSSSSTTSSTSSTSSTTSFPATKKQKKRKHADDGGAGGAPQQPRRCSHCGVTKTPQWRAGPLGSKTLCNACGVRFKSGRLLPEYRPACSPTFSSELHSNNHRKVLEMRRKMEELETGPAGSF